MDLFNKKKVKNLERELIIVRQELERNKGELIVYKNDESMYSNLIKENQKLITWIESILKEFGTVETRESHVSIPIYKNEHKPIFYTEDDIEPFFKEREYIEIPAITIVKMR